MNLNYEITVVIRILTSKDDEDTISRFLKRLCVDIKERILLQIDATHEYWDVVKIILEVELQIKRERKQVLKRVERMQEHIRAKVKKRSRVQ